MKLTGPKEDIMLNRKDKITHWVASHRVCCRGGGGALAGTQNNNNNNNNINNNNNNKCNTYIAQNSSYVYDLMCFTIR